MTAAAPLTASKGSVVTATLAPVWRTQAISASSGASSGGLATLMAKSNFWAAWTQLASTLLESPLQATVRPLMGPRCSSKVRMSAIT